MASLYDSFKNVFGKGKKRPADPKPAPTTSDTLPNTDAAEGRAEALGGMAGKAVDAVTARKKAMKEAMGE